MLWPLWLLHGRTKCFASPPWSRSTSTTATPDATAKDEDKKKTADTAGYTDDQRFVVVDPRANLLDGR